MVSECAVIKSIDGKLAQCKTVDVIVGQGRQKSNSLCCVVVPGTMMTGWER
jgi:hypothetical protein